MIAWKTVRSLVFYCALSIAVAAETPTTEVQHRLPAMSSVFPQGANPGATVRVEVLGEHMDRAHTVFFLDESIRARILQTEHTRLELEFEISSQAAWGPHYFRIVSPRGASNILLFRVGDQPHLIEHEPNSTRAQAERVNIPVTINGRLNVDGDFDFYKFRAATGQSWIFDLRAARNGNGLDAALILMDVEGRKLAHSEERFIWDPFFEHTFERSGDYIVVVQPTHARNDPSFGYQLDIRSAPYLETIAPLAFQPGREVEATLFGAGLRDGGSSVRFDSPGFSGSLVAARGSSALLKIRVPPDASSGPHELYLETTRGRSNSVTFLIDPTPAHKGGEQIMPPVSITGTARYRQPERFRLQAKAGQTLTFEVRAQRFGSPTDSTLRLLNPSGKPIAVNDDAQFSGVAFNKDSRLSYTFADAGEYTLEMRNVSSVTGENYPYQLLVREPDPGFDLMLGSDQPYVYPGDTATLKVTAARRDGFDSAITVNAAQPFPGLVIESGEARAASNEAELRITAGEVVPGLYGQLSLKAGGQTAWRSVRIASGGGEGATFGRVETATVVVAERPDFSLEAALSTVNLVRGGSAEIPVMIRRRPGFERAIRFSCLNLPQGVSLDPIESTSDAVILRLSASPAAMLGRASRIAILGTYDGHRFEQAPKISIVVD